MRLRAVWNVFLLCYHAIHHTLMVMNNVVGIKLDGDRVREIEELAVGLSRSEILSVFMRTEEDLTPAEERILTLAMARGRALAKAHAARCLANQMAGKNGVTASLSYLIRFADEWESLSQEESKHVLTIRDETGRNIIPDQSVKIT
jgi:hypothetical protein